MVNAIFRHEGTVDKFVGDAILAVFGSPEPDAKQHVNAVQAAMAMQEAIEEINDVRRANHQVVCEIGIGIHCGEVLHGFIGSEERMEFTVIGDAVNRASRYLRRGRARTGAHQPRNVSTRFQTRQRQPDHDQDQARRRDASLQRRRHKTHVDNHSCRRANDFLQSVSGKALAAGDFVIVLHVLAWRIQSSLCRRLAPCRSRRYAPPDS